MQLIRLGCRTILADRLCSSLQIFSSRTMTEPVAFACMDALRGYSTLGDIASCSFPHPTKTLGRWICGSVGELCAVLHNR